MEHHEQQPPGEHPNLRGAGEQHRAAQPRIWIGSRSDYNAGMLFGVWIDAGQNPADLHEAAAALLAYSPIDTAAHQWAVFDYQNFGPLHVEEDTNLETVSRLARGLIEHGPAYAGWVHLVGADHADQDKFDDAYLGRWDNLHAYAEDLLIDLGYNDLSNIPIPDNLRPYLLIDVDAFARDLQAAARLRSSTAMTAESGYSTPTRDPEPFRAPPRRHAGLAPVWNEQHLMRIRITPGIVDHESRRPLMTPEQAARLGRTIRRRRQEQGLSTRALAAQVGANMTTIVRIEGGHFAAPRPDLLSAIAAALDLPMADVFAMADYVVPGELPTPRPYLRAKYPHWPDEAVEQVNRYIARLVRKHGGLQPGPKPGQDEQ